MTPSEAKSKIRDQELFLRLLTDNLPDMLWAKDLKGRYLFANQAICDKLLMAENAEEVVGKTDVFFAQRERDRHSENPDWHTFGELCFNSDEITLQHDKPMRFEEYGNVKGTLLYLEVYKAPFYDQNGMLIGTIGSARDITRQKALEQGLKNANSTFENLLDSTIEGLLVFDTELRCIQANLVACELTGYSETEIIGKHALDDFTAADSVDTVARNIGHPIASPYEMELKRKDGSTIPVLAQGKNMRLFDKDIRVSALMDIRSIKEAKRQIEQLAYYDELTGLENRRLMEIYTKEVISQGARMRKYSALMLLDIDHFKKINDSSGHEMGDQLLKNVAEKLKTSVRSNDHVMRMGGDEFVILLGHLHENETEAALVAEHIALEIQGKLRHTLDDPDFKTRYFEPTASIGITTFCDNEKTPQSLLKEADIALYVAKDAGRNTIRFYNQKMQQQLEEQIQLEREIKHAIENREFELYYQPIVNQCGKVIAAEALSRWNHPEKGVLSPARFIPAAEKSGQILAIGAWVLHSACRQLSHWHRNPDSMFSHIKVSVNVSARQVGQPEFIQSVRTALETYGIKPGMLKLELTESLLAIDLKLVAQKIEELSGMGVSVALDDFGTGFSSLSYLKNLSISTIKIDRSFVDGIPSDPNDIAIIEATMAIAQSLQLDTIAEGIETEAQLEYLSKIGCTCFQGFHFARPLPVNAFEAYLAQTNASGPRRA